MVALWIYLFALAAVVVVSAVFALVLAVGDWLGRALSRRRRLPKGFFGP